MNCFFISDDFVFIDSIKSGKSPYKYWPVPVFVRPLIMLSYFVDCKLWNLNPIGYHLTNILIHSINSFLICLISFSILSYIGYSKKQKYRISTFAAILFLVFFGHTESVSWISGRTDIFAVWFILLSFYCYLLFRQKGKRAPVILSYVFYILALLSKEISFVYPFIILAFDFFVIKMNSCKKKIHRLVDISNGIFFLILGLNFVFRYFVLGTVFSKPGHGYAFFSTNFFGIIKNFIRFILRVLFPYGEYLQDIRFNLGLIILFITVILIFFIRKTHKKEFYIFVFLITTSFITLLPAYSWRVSLTDTQGERFLYFTTVFSSLLIVLLIESLFTRIILKKVAMIALIIINLLFLYRSNINWKNAGVTSKNILDSFTNQMEKSSINSTDKIIILNLPDNINGAYIFRNGFYESINLFYPDISTQNIIIISLNSLKKINDGIDVTAIDETTFYIKLENNQSGFMQSPSSLEPYYKILKYFPNRYDIRFYKVGKVNYFVYNYSEGALNKVKKIDKLKGPFGYIDLPIDDDKVGKDIRIEGWALSESKVIKIEIKREAIESDPDSIIGDEGLVFLGDAKFLEGLRPDVVKAFPEYPFNFRAGWRFMLPRKALPNNFKGEIKIHVIAYDEEGYKKNLGVKTIVF